MAELVQHLSKWFRNSLSISNRRLFWWLNVLFVISALSRKTIDRCRQRIWITCRDKYAMLLCFMVLMTLGCCIRTALKYLVAHKKMTIMTSIKLCNQRFHHVSFIPANKMAWCPPKNVADYHAYFTPFLSLGNANILPVIVITNYYWSILWLRYFE